MVSKVIIGVAPVGAWGEGHNNPTSPTEIARQVRACADEGAAYVHLHVRDDRGTLTEDLSVFRETLGLIKSACDVIVNASTGGASNLSPEQRSVALGVEAVETASLNMGSCNFFGGVYINSPNDIGYWAAEMKRKGIKPEFAAFEPGMIANAREIIAQGMDEPPHVFGIALGFTGALPASPRNLVFMIESLPPESVWGLVYHGGHDFFKMQALALASGAALVRCGFEDSRHLSPGVTAIDNVELVRKTVRLAREVGLEIASASEARRMLGLRDRI